MTLQQAIGQLFMVGLPGTSVGPAFTELIDRWSIGNVVLFARNLTDGPQALQLTTDLQRLVTNITGHPALISADQEGGIVLRLVTGATAFPGNMAIGATQKPQLARAVARAIGEELLALGINMNLAPVLDINNNPHNPVIGVRSFGTTADTVSAFGRESVAGYRESGILAVAKHFPGHGDTTVDSHTGLPVIEKTAEQLLEWELVPFRAATEAGIDAIMTAHIMFPQIDDVPATLSRNILTDILRVQLGFDGLIITDSMRMTGVSGHYGPAEAAVMALQAGCDILLYSAMGDVEEQAVKGVHEAVRNGTLSEERIFASAQRVLAAKQRLAQPPAVDLSAHRALAKKVSEQAITVVRDEASLLPVQARNLTVIEVKRRAITQVEEQLTDRGIQSQLQKRLPQAQYLSIGTNPEDVAVDEIIARIDGDTVVVITQDAWRNPGQQQLLRGVATDYPERTIVVAGRLPYDTDLEPSIPTAICTYDLVTTTIEALLAVLVGDLQATGALPQVTA